MVIGVAATFASQTLALPSHTQKPWEYVIVALLAVFFGGQKISVNQRRKQERAMSMTLGFAIAFAAMIRMGPAAAVPVAMLGCLSGCLYPRRQKIHQISFNLALSATQAFASGMAYVAVNGWSLGDGSARMFGAVGAASLVFFFINTAGVAKMISLCSGEAFGRIWKENFGWTGPSYVASACAGAFAMILFNGNTSGMLLFVVPIAYFVFHSFGTHLALVEEKLVHLEEVREKQTELADLYLSTIKSLALAIDAKDPFTHQHIIRAQRYAVALAKEMGLANEEVQAIGTGALLHDIGKLGVPESVLLKPGALTAAEFELMKQHPTIGAGILGPVAFPSPVMPVVKHHHEKWDGTGYPSGLKGEEIPLPARIMAIADVYDALTSVRSYRAAMTHQQAIAIITRDAGTHFDPEVVQAFLRVIDSVVAEMAGEGMYGPGRGPYLELYAGDDPNASAHPNRAENTEPVKYSKPPLGLS